MQFSFVIDMEACHVSCTGSAVGGVQDVEQAIVIAQADGTGAMGGKDAGQGEMPVMDVDDGNLVASGVHGEQPCSFVVRDDERTLRAIGKGQYTAHTADGGCAGQG